MTRALVLAALIAVAAARPAEAAARGCADHWAVELDKESFAQNGTGRTFTPARLAAFRAKVALAVKGAVTEACRRGKVRPALAAQVRRIDVVSASGVTEAMLYQVGRDRRTLTFALAFAESDLQVPPRREILDGLACWTNPRSQSCAELDQD